MRFFSSFILIVAMLSTPVFAQDNSLFKSKDIFSLEYANDPQISPDGRKVVYVRNSNNIMTDNKNRSLWLIDVKTQKQLPLFSDEKQYSQPRWSADGKKIAFISNLTGSNQAKQGGKRFYYHSLRWQYENESANI